MVVVGLVGFVGWYVFNAQTKTNEALSNTEQTNQSNTVIPQKEVVDSEGYLFVKEWDVSIKLPEKVEGIRYYPINLEAEVKKQYPTDYQSIGLTAKAVEDLGGSCDFDPAAGNSSASLVVLARTKTKLENLMSTAELGKKGDYYYYGSASQAACMSADGKLSENGGVEQTVRAKLTKILDAFELKN